MSTKTIDFYWDIGSTNTYFALHLIRPIASRHAARLRYRPFNLGYVFRAQGYVLAEEPRVKLRHRRDDLMRWAKRYDLPFRMPDTFPIKTSRALRGALAMREHQLEEAYLDALFAAYWEQNDASIADYAGLKPLVAKLGVDPAQFETRSESVEIKQQLIDEVAAGMARGAFGAPTFFIGEEMFWGKDRMEFIEDAFR